MDVSGIDALRALERLEFLCLSTLERTQIAFEHAHIRVPFLEIGLRRPLVANALGELAQLNP